MLPSFVLNNKVRGLVAASVAFETFRDPHAVGPQLGHHRLVRFGRAVKRAQQGANQEGALHGASEDGHY